MLGNCKMIEKLICGDCLQEIEKMAQEGVKADAIVCDLPYGSSNCTWDEIIPFDRMWQAINNIRKDNSAILLFGNEPFASKLRVSNLAEYKYDIYWQKERPTNIFQLKKRPAKVIETISVFYKEQCTYNPQMTEYKGTKRTNKIKHGRIGTLMDGQNKQPYAYQDNGQRYPLQIVKCKRDTLTVNLHPTQKPLALMEYLIKTFTNEGDVVLDFCMGSGTTCLASKLLNRGYIGIEQDKHFFEIAKKRINLC